MSDSRSEPPPPRPALIGSGLKRSQALFLGYLATQPSATRAEYQLLAGVSRQTAQNDLAELVARNFVVRLGRSVSCRYLVPGDLGAAQKLPESCQKAASSRSANPDF